MTKQMGALTALVGVVVSAPAFAGTTLTVDNRFDGEAEVWVDGRIQGMVQGDSRMVLDTHAGKHSVVVRRPVSNFVLLSTDVHLTNNTATLLPVTAPLGQIRIDNTGEVRLKVVTDGVDPVWIAPGTAAILTVPSGQVDLKASIMEPRGEWMAVERMVWMEPGEPARSTLKPDPTVIILTNRDRLPVHAMLDGVDAGWIAGGETQRVWVRPGPTQVVLLDKGGHVRTTTQVVVKKGNETQIVVQPSVVVIPVASR